jgi:hypothetical protein
MLSKQFILIKQQRRRNRILWQQNLKYRQASQTASRMLWQTLSVFLTAVLTRLNCNAAYLNLVLPILSEILASLQLDVAWTMFAILIAMAYFSVIQGLKSGEDSHQSSALNPSID